MTPLVIACKQCGAAVEESRRCYATPVCYACLLPPEPLPLSYTKSHIDRARAAVQP